MNVVVIGGGVTGLSAAWYLERAAARERVTLRVTVLEASGRWGGKVLTERVCAPGGGSFVFEAGPDSFLSRKPWAIDLAIELGLEERLIPTNEHPRALYVLHRGKPVAMPEGMMLSVPAKLMPFLRSPLISPLGKLRMGMEWFLPPRRGAADETLGAFVRRRLGREALETLAEPLMSGIYSADPERQSLLATFPAFREMEQRHGGLLRGALHWQRDAKRTSREGGRAPFMSLAGGTQELVDALVGKLDAALLLNSQVTAIAAGGPARWRVSLAGERGMDADAVLVTTPATIAADLLHVAPEVSRALAGIRHVSTGTLSIAFHAEDVRRPLGGFGLVVPERERRVFNAMTIASAKFNHRAPEGYTLVRLFFGGSRHPETTEWDDERLLAAGRDELRALLEIAGEPLVSRVYRWPQANPQYDVGHLERVAAIERALPDGLSVAGCAMGGVGVPDCVRQGREWAESLISTLRSHAGRPG